MNTNKTRAGWTKRLCLPLLALALVCGGCESEDTDESISPDRFNISRELRNYSSTDDYAWDTTVTRAVVTLRINDFTEGDTTLRVYDGAGKLVLTGGFNTADSVYFTGEDMFFQRQTDSGAAGNWTIVVGYDDFTGDYDLTLE